MAKQNQICLSTHKKPRTLLWLFLLPTRKTHLCQSHQNALLTHAVGQHQEKTRSMNAEKNTGIPTMAHGKDGQKLHLILENR